MSEILQTNVFFVITSIAVVSVTILLCFALFHFILILRNVREISERLKRGSEQLAEDAQAVRSFVQEGVIGTVRNLFFRSAPKRASPRPKKERKNETVIDNDVSVDEKVI